MVVLEVVRFVQFKVVVLKSKVGSILVRNFRSGKVDPILVRSFRSGNVGGCCMPCGKMRAVLGESF